MTKEKNIAFIHRFFEEQAIKDSLFNYEEFVDRDVLIHGPASEQKTKGISEFKKLESSCILASSKKQFFLEEVWSLNDRIFVRWLCKGYYEKPHEETSLKNRKFSITGVTIYRMKNDKIAEIWQYWDRLGLLEQLRVISVHRDSSHAERHLQLSENLDIAKYFAQVPLLSQRERQCLNHLLEGKTAKETAHIYNLSSRTVESYFENIKKKLNCWNKRDLFVVAQSLAKEGLL